MALKFSPESLPKDSPMWISLDRDGRWGEPGDVALKIQRAGLTEIFDLQTRVIQLRNIVVNLEGDQTSNVGGVIEYIINKYVIGWKGIVDDDNSERPFKKEEVSSILATHNEALMDFVIGLMAYNTDLIGEEKKESLNGQDGLLEEVSQKVDKGNGRRGTATKRASRPTSRARAVKKELTGSIAQI